MAGAARLLCLLSCLQLAASSEPACVIELECAECVPAHLPLVTSHRAAGGRVTVAAGEELTLSCGAGRLLAYPLRAAVTARCEAGRYRVPQDGRLRHLLELGCQENVFEDVLHTVEHCAAPLQGRAYRVREGAAAGAHHLATLCFDADRGVPLVARAAAALRLPPHAEPGAPLTLLGNFNHMFDASTRNAAERLYSDDERLNRRLRELFKHDHFSFASQTLTSAKLLSAHYFEDQNMRVTDFVSNELAVWRSVASGNLEHLQRDVAKLLKMSRPHGALEVYAGTHGVLSLRTGPARADVFLQPGRFPVPRYVWTVVLDAAAGRALALVVLNDPFVAVSEIRDAVFCESACGSVPWLHELRRHRNYEVPAYGLAFCCAVHEFAAVVTEMPAQALAGVARGAEGMLTELKI